MKLTRIALLFLCVVCSAFSSHAQTAQHWRGDIPFTFKIKNQIFQPGTYDISLDINHGVMSLTNNLHPGEHMTWLGIPSDRAAVATMRFALAGDQYMLTSVAAGNWRTLPPHLPSNTQEAMVVFPQ